MPIKIFILPSLYATGSCDRPEEGERTIDLQAEARAIDLQAEERAIDLKVEERAAEKK